MKMPALRSLAAIVATAALILYANCSFAAAITNWVQDTAFGSGTVVTSDMATNSPVVGNGSSNNAVSGIITSAFPASLGTLGTVSLDDGESIVLSGSMEIIGAKSSGRFLGVQLGLMYNAGAPANTNGWLGYKIENSNNGSVPADVNAGNLKARTSSGTNFATNHWASSSSGRDTNIVTVPAASNGIFSSGTYDFGITVKRVGSDLEVSGSIVGTGTTVFSNIFSPVLVTAATQKTFDFNRVGLWSVAQLEADQIRFSNIDVTVVPEPSSFSFLGIAICGLMGFRSRR